MSRVLCVVGCLLALAQSASAANRTVCASGCQYSTVQAAIDAAQAGDVILLRAGETFTENLILRAKSTTSTAYITIRSDAPDTSFPAANTRLVPPGKSGANVSSGKLARLVGRTGAYKTYPVVRTETGAHHYRLQFLDIDGLSSEGWYTLVQIGENSSTQTLSNAPHHITLDRVYAHGHPAKGMQRGVAVNGSDLEVLNSYLCDFFGMYDTQGIAGFNGAGPVRIENNYVEAGAENILFGGADPKTANLVPSDILIRGNHVTKNRAWTGTVLATPAQPSASAATGGALSSGTHYFTVVALMPSASDTVWSTPSPEVAVSVGSSGAVRLAWSSVANATAYRVYRGTSSRGERVYTQTTGTSLTYTGSGESSGAPSWSGSKWVIKNLLELKNARRVTIDGNVFENVWPAGQVGYAVLFTPRNQDGAASWSVVRDVSFTNNVVRRVAAGIVMLGHDDTNPSQPLQNVRVANNLFYDVGSSYGGSGNLVVMTEGPSGVVIEHNTIDNTGTVVMIDTAPVSGFVYRNNFSKHNSYGILGSNYGIGLPAIAAYLPGAIVTGDVLAGGTASSYPPGNFFPSVSTFNASFVNAPAGNYALVSGSPFKGAATDGKDIGIDATVPALAQAGAFTSTTGGSTSGGTTGGTTNGGGTPVSISPLPGGWTGGDIGSPAVGGASGTNGSSYTVKGAGLDIWGNADQFQFAYRTLSGDGSIVARVASFSGSDPWAKAGVMIRAGAGGSSAHASMIVSVGRGTGFFRRKSDGSASIYTAGNSAAAPEWVRLTRSGSTVTAAVSNDGSSWTTVGSDTVSLPATVLVGLAVTSHTSSNTATATFDSVSFGGFTGTLTSTPAPAGTLPSGWANDDIGPVGVSGTASASGGTFTVRGAGSDIWGGADAFQFAYLPLSGDGTIVARVTSLAGDDDWTKAGVMVRASLSASAAHGVALVSVARGAAFQRRPSYGGASLNTAGGSYNAPVWLKMTRAGNTLTAAVSRDGAAWTVIGSDSVSLPTDVLVGLAVTNHSTYGLATATFDNVSISAGASLPSAWSSRDVGPVGLAGAASASGGTLTVQGAGADIWGSTDAFRFVYRTLSGDGRIVARIAAVNGTDPWTKVGVMMRQTLDPGSAHALMLASLGRGLAFQRRTITGGGSFNTSGSSGPAPVWVRLTRSGTTVTAAVSSDGTNWTTVGSDTISLTGSIYVGVVVSSHNPSALATGLFDNVSVTP